MLRQAQQAPTTDQETSDGPREGGARDALGVTDPGVDGAGVGLQGQDGVDGVQLALQVEDPDGGAEAGGARAVRLEAGVCGWRLRDAVRQAIRADRGHGVPQRDHRAHAHRRRREEHGDVREPEVCCC